MNRILSTLFLLLPLSISYAAEPREMEQLGAVFAAYGAEGSFLIWDSNANEYMGYNLDRCAEAFSPASTFKIPNTLIALETGVVTPASVFEWDGSKRAMSSWEQDVDLTEAFRRSVVPVYQEIARRIGTERMRYYIAMLDYGDMDINEENIDKFWLEGDSRISQYQQVNFLTRLYRDELPVSREAMIQTKKIMLHEVAEDYSLSGKTGWAVRHERNIMWFIGWLETADNTYIFALNVEPSGEMDATDFSRYRIELAKNIFLELGIITQYTILSDGLLGANS